MTPPGLPHPPPTGASALPAGTYDGTVVLVTGGGTGLGKSIATEFGRLGASVAVVSRDEGHRAAGVAAVEEAGGRASPRRATSATPMPSPRRSTPSSRSSGPSTCWSTTRPATSRYLPKT